MAASVLGTSAVSRQRTDMILHVFIKNFLSDSDSESELPWQHQYWGPRRYRRRYEREGERESGRVGEWEEGEGEGLSATASGTLSHS